MERSIPQDILLAFKAKHLIDSFNFDEQLEFNEPSFGLTANSPPLKPISRLNKPQETQNGRKIKLNPLEELNWLMRFLHAEENGSIPMDIDVADTIFYDHENQVVYFYFDAKRGFTKIKGRFKAFEAYTKRNLRTSSSSPDSSARNTTRQPQLKLKLLENSQLYNDAATLRYKDGTFIRLKQTDLMNVFKNPLYANEKIKHLNNTSMIQQTPSAVVELDGAIVVNFNYSKFQGDPLFVRLFNLVSHEFLSSQSDVKDSFRNRMRRVDPRILAHEIVFQIYFYLSMHHKKRLLSGQFYFYPSNRSAGLMLYSVENISYCNFPNEGEFEKIELLRSIQDLNPAVECNSSEQFNFFNDGTVKASALEVQLETFMNKINQHLKEDVTTFLNNKIEEIVNKPDQQISKQIFRTLNPNVTEDFHKILMDDKKLEAIVSQKVAIKPKKAFTPLLPEPKKTSKPRDLRPVQIPKKSFVYMGMM